MLNNCNSLSTKHRALITRIMKMNNKKDATLEAFTELMNIKETVFTCVSYLIKLEIFQVDFLKCLY
jgi:hypothetical protein